MGRSSLLRISVQLITCLEALSLYTFVRLNGKSWLAHLAEDIIDLSDLVLVLQVDASHQQWDIASQDIADEHALTSVREFGNSLNIFGGTLIKT